MSEEPETQKQRAQWLIEEMDHYMIPVAQCHEFLRELLDRAQNDPPHGDSDGTISPLEFSHLREIENAIKHLRRALECCQITSSSSSEIPESIDESESIDEP
jgi:hypothetical protein